MNDFFSRRHGQFIHIIDDGIYITLTNFIYGTAACYHSAMLHTLDVLSGNTHMYIADLHA